MTPNNLIQLSLTEGIGPATINKLLTLPTPITDFSAQDLHSTIQISYTLAEKILAGLTSSTLLEHELKLVAKCNANIITILDPEYPEPLKHIHAPPPVLYYQGAPPTSQHAVAIVGSRAANAYGKKVLHTLIPPLVEAGCTITSGGARGVDAYAHYETLQARGKTIVVLGSGLLKPYPPEHYKLFANIIANDGTILSPFSMATDPTQGNFPARNRIIAGLSTVCVVIQAAVQSGALITAKYALEQGRDVLAVPGHIDDPLSTGCHSLIQQGAGLVHSAQDILNALGISEQPLVPHAVEQIEAGPLPLDKKILILCSKQAKSIDDLAEELNLDPSDLHNPLFQLQIAGKLTQNMAGLYEPPQPF